MGQTQAEERLPNSATLHKRNMPAPRHAAGPLARYDSEALLPATFSEMKQMADLVAASQFAPKDFQGKPGDCLIAMQMGVEVGLKPMQALQNVAVINGRPTLWGDAQLAIVMSHPQFEGIRETFDVDDAGVPFRAVCQVKRRGMPVVSRDFSLEDAGKAGLLGKPGPWKNYPKRMMQMRARAFALRDAFADALKGISAAEEAIDGIVAEGDTFFDDALPVAPAPLPERTETRAQTSDDTRREPKDGELDRLVFCIQASENRGELDELMKEIPTIRFDAAQLTVLKRECHQKLQALTGDDAGAAA